jgi:hypothetical protein
MSTHKLCNGDCADHDLSIWNRGDTVSHRKTWRNYTCVYSRPIDKEVLIQRMRIAMRDRKFSDKGIIL